ncbi:MAG: chorismate mutase [Candidatus Hermodarchaeota archaeon]
MIKNDVFDKKLRVYRKKIDKLDNKIVELLNKRGKITQKVGNLKKQFSKDISQPLREKEIIERMKKKSVILSNLAIETIWNNIIAACKILEE